MTRNHLVMTALAVMTTAAVLASCDSDVTFAQGMIPHHEGAIEMARLASGRTDNPRILDLAARIEKAQRPV